MAMTTSIADGILEVVTSTKNGRTKIEVRSHGKTLYTHECCAWIPIGERLPENFQLCLVCEQEDEEGWVDRHVASWSFGSWKYPGMHHGHREIIVTHWMPLPSPP